jgi:hypothetical protein
MKKYRKKPVEIEAVQRTRSNHFQVKAWIEEGGGECTFSSDHLGQLGIRTLESTMWANLGDWIIRGVQGEFYPCKPDIFAATYEEV